MNPGSASAKAGRNQLSLGRHGDPLGIKGTCCAATDWHNIMHMIADLAAEDVHRAMTEDRRFDAGDYVRRLNALPGDWPAPEATERD